MLGRCRAAWFRPAGCPAGIVPTATHGTPGSAARLLRRGAVALGLGDQVRDAPLWRPVRGPCGTLRLAPEEAAGGGPRHRGLRARVVVRGGRQLHRSGRLGGRRPPDTAAFRRVHAGDGTGGAPGNPVRHGLDAVRHGRDGRGRVGHRSRADAARRGYPVGRHPRHRHPIGPGQLLGNRQREHRPHRVRSASPHHHRAAQHHAQRDVELVRRAGRARRNAVEHPARPVDADEQRRRVARAGVQLPAPLPRERPHRGAALAQRLVDLGGQIRPEPLGAGRGQRAHRQPARRQHHVHGLQPAVLGLDRHLAAPRHRHLHRAEVDPLGPGVLAVEVALVEGPERGEAVAGVVAAVAAARAARHPALQRERTDGPGAGLVAGFHHIVDDRPVRRGTPTARRRLRPGRPGTASAARHHRLPPSSRSWPPVEP